MSGYGLHMNRGDGSDEPAPDPRCASPPGARRHRLESSARSTVRAVTVWAPHASVHRAGPRLRFEVPGAARSSEFRAALSRTVVPFPRTFEPCVRATPLPPAPVSRAVPSNHFRPRKLSRPARLCLINTNFR